MDKQRKRFAPIIEQTIMPEFKVKVGVRIRPLSSSEKDKCGAIPGIETQDNHCISSSGFIYSYDHAFGMEVNQDQLYLQCAAPFLDTFIQGYNCSIIAYGQTGSGKTYTMGPTKLAKQDTKNEGLMGRFVTELFQNLMVKKASGCLVDFKIKVSYVEIYDEKVYDLLPKEYTSHPVTLKVHEDKGKKYYAQDLQEHSVGDAASTLSLLTTGASRRATAATAANARSSRSHALFTLHLEQMVSKEKEVQVLRSMFTFVDLAGSERVAQTGAEGQRRKEGISINQGLVELRKVIVGLVDAGKPNRNKEGSSGDKENAKQAANRQSKKQEKLNGKVNPVYVNYRGSNLTKLLKDALGGNSQTLFLACVSPAAENERETKSTLEYASLTGKIKNTPVQNASKVHTQQQQQHHHQQQQLHHLQVEELESRLHASDAAKQLATLRAQELEKELQASRDAQSRVENELREKEALIRELQAERTQFSTLSEKERVPVEDASGCSGEEEARGDGKDGSGDDAADHDHTAMHAAPVTLHKRKNFSDDAHHNSLEGIAKRTKLSWNDDMDVRLLEAVHLHSTAWTKVSEHMGGGVTGKQCEWRWYRCLRHQEQGLKKGGDWTEAELAALSGLVKQHTQKPKWSDRRQVIMKERIDWVPIGQELKRVPAECNNKWTSILQSKMKKDPYTAEEDALIRQRVAEWGDKGPGLWVGLQEEIGRPLMNIRSRWYIRLCDK